MSDNLRYKDSITPNQLTEWKLTDGIFDNSKIVLNPGGYMQFVKAPKDDVDKSVSQKYKIVITYGDPIPQLYSKVDYMFEMHLVPNEKDGLHKAVSTSAHPNMSINGNMTRCVTYVDANGGIASQFKLFIRNLSDGPITIVSVDVYPSYTIDDTTLSEMEQYMPSILHYSNNDAIDCIHSTRIVSMDISTTIDTNLNLHLLLNGTASFADEITLDFKVNGEHLQYSPLEFSVPEGRFLIGIPANIMQVESGTKKFEVILNSTADIQFKANKIQCTIDGKGMINKSSAAAPSAFETVKIPVKDVPSIIVTDVSVDNEVLRPICVNTSESIEIKQLNNYGSITQLVDTEMVRVAEDIWFGPTFENGFDNCEHEVFIYNSHVIYIDDGCIKFKDSDAKSVKLKDVSEHNYGNIYSIDIDNTHTRLFERLDISPIMMSISSENIPLNSDTLVDTVGYDTTRGIKIITDRNFEIDDVTVHDETYTSIDITVDETDYNDISELE